MNITRYKRFFRTGLALPAISIFFIIIGSNLVSWRINERRTGDAKYYVIQGKGNHKNKPRLSVVTADGGSADTVNSFNAKLLKLILNKSGHPYTLTIYSHSFNQDSLVRALETSEEFSHRWIEKVNVAVMGASTDLNQSLRRIPIPVTGGLLGMRVGFAHRQYLPILSRIKDARGLSHISLLQGVGWRDVEILDASGLRTYVARPSELLRIVESGQAHLFLRGISEVGNELKAIRKATEHIVLDPHLVVIYPFSGFFYVQREDIYLAEVLEQGFRAAIRDGSYRKLLKDELYTASFRKSLRLKERAVIYIPNPDVASFLNGVDRQFWLVPWDDLSNGKISSGHQLCSLKTISFLCQKTVD